MIPSAPDALRMLSQRILSHLVPNAASTYAMSDGAMVGMLLTALAGELESGIERRLTDIDAMKAIFRLAAAQLDNAALPADLQAVLESGPASLTMSSVNETHDAHARVLIALHEVVDAAAAGENERAINEAIWQYLGEHAGRNVLPI